MWLLAIDTTGKDASVALAREGRLTALVAPRHSERHSVQLFRSIQQALHEGGIAQRDVDLYAVANGPGAFTGLRVGLTVVKGLAEMHRKPVVPVSVLEALCEGAGVEGLLVPVVDAYRGQVFGGIYDNRNGELLRRAEERVLPLEEFLAALEAQGIQTPGCTFVGPHLNRWTTQFERSCFSASRREIISPVLADAVARRAERKFFRGEAVDALRLEANYVRRSDAELLWKEK